MESYTYSQNLNHFIEKVDEIFEKDSQKVDSDFCETLLNSLESLKLKFPSECENDPLFKLLKIRIKTKNFTDYKDFKTVRASAYYGLYDAEKTNTISPDERRFKASNPIVSKYSTSLETFVNRYFKRRRHRNAAIISLSSLGALLTFFIVLASVAPGAIIFFRHKIHFNVDGVEYTSNVVYNEKYSIEIPKKIGYKFLGLFDGEGESAKMVVDENGNSLGKYGSAWGDETYYARFDARSFTFCINPNKGIVTGTETKQVTYNTECMNDIVFTSATREHCDFAGFFKDADKTLKLADINGKLLKQEYKLFVADYYEVTDSNVLNVYAGWDGHYFKVNFDTNGGSPLESVIDKVQYDEKTKLPTSTTKFGHTFDGWFVGDKRITDANGEMLDKWNYAEEVTLTAHWAHEVYKIRFKNAAGDVVINAPYNEPVIIPQFKGRKYETNPVVNLDGNYYKPGDEYFMIHGSDIEVEVIWDQNGWNYISTPSDLANLESKGMNGKYCLLNDINVSTYINWQPIGGTTSSFTKFGGTLDGDNHFIIGLRRTGEVPEDGDRLYFGLFGGISNTGIIKNLKISASIEITGPANNNSNMREFIGIVAGQSNGGTLENVYVSGSVSYSCCTNGETWMGGLVGHSYKSEITNCSSAAELYVKRDFAFAGGLVGFSQGGKIENSKVSCDVTAIGIDSFGFMWLDHGKARASLVGATCHAEDITKLINLSLEGTVKTDGYDHSGKCESYSSTTDFAHYDSWGY